MLIQPNGNALGYIAVDQIMKHPPNPLKRGNFSHPLSEGAGGNGLKSSQIVKKHPKYFFSVLGGMGYVAKP